MNTGERSARNKADSPDNGCHLASVIFMGMAAIVLSSKVVALEPYGSKMAFVAHEGYYTPGPLRYVRVNSDGSVYVAPIDGMTERDATNAEFKKVNGLSDGACISFESTKYPGHYLRHTNYVIRLQARPWYPSTSFNDSATFCLSTPKGGGYSQGYESFNRKEYYIRADGSALVLRQVGYESLYPEDYRAITFHELAGPVTLKLYNQGSLSWAPLTYTDGAYHVVQYSGACTGFASWWAWWRAPPTKWIGWWLQYSGKEVTWPGQWRLVESSATGTVWGGFYPWISFYIPLRAEMNFATQQGYVAKIKTGSTWCMW